MEVEQGLTCQKREDKFSRKLQEREQREGKKWQQFRDGGNEKRRKVVLNSHVKFCIKEDEDM